MRIDLALAAVEVGADKVNRLEPFRRFHRFELLEGNIRLAGILLDNIARPLIEIIAGRDAVLIEQAVGVPERTEKAAVIIEEFLKSIADRILVTSAELQPVPTSSAAMAPAEAPEVCLICGMMPLASSNSSAPP